MDPDKVFVVRSGPSLERLKIVPPVEALKQRPASYLVGYVGVMGRQEGIDYLLRAAAHIVHELGRNDVHFGLVGGGTSLEEMKALARELGVADYVTFTGRVPDAELLAMLNTADVCVNPDVANEMNDKSTMNKIMEYMALGKPIVQFDLDRGPLLGAGRLALRAAQRRRSTWREKIVELLDDPERRAAHGRLRPPARARTSSNGATRRRSYSPRTRRCGARPATSVRGQHSLAGVRHPLHRRQSPPPEGIVPLVVLTRIRAVLATMESHPAADPGRVGQEPG